MSPISRAFKKKTATFFSSPSGISGVLARRARCGSDRTNDQDASAVGVTSRGGAVWSRRCLPSGVIFVWTALCTAVRRYRRVVGCYLRVSFIWFAISDAIACIFWLAKKNKTRQYRQAAGHGRRLPTDITIDNIAAGRRSFVGVARVVAYSPFERLFLYHSAAVPFAAWRDNALQSAEDAASPWRYFRGKWPETPSGR